MDTSNLTHVRLKSRSFLFELEGREEFVGAEYPKLLDWLERMIRSQAAICAEALRTDTASAQGTLAGIEQEVQQLKNELDSLSDLGETESLRLQMAMDRMSKMMSTLSNILKKISDTAASIVQNLK
jgi:hypothetical protein